MTTTKTLAFAGSARKESFNKKLVKITSFAPVKSSDRVKREKWLAEVEELGRKQK